MDLSFYFEISKKTVSEALFGLFTLVFLPNSRDILFFTVIRHEFSKIFSKKGWDDWISESRLWNPFILLILMFISSLKMFISSNSQQTHLKNKSRRCINKRRNRRYLRLNFYKLNLYSKSYLNFFSWLFQIFVNFFLMVKIRSGERAKRKN